MRLIWLVGCVRDNDSVTISNYDVIMFEGILAFYHQSHREMMDMKLFVDTDADLRLSRRGNESSTMVIPI